MDTVHNIEYVTDEMEANLLEFTRQMPVGTKCRVLHHGGDINVTKYVSLSARPGTYYYTLWADDVFGRLDESELSCLTAVERIFAHFDLTRV
jgi:hypothetical protein